MGECVSKGTLFFVSERLVFYVLWKLLNFHWISIYGSRYSAFENLALACKE